MKLSNARYSLRALFLGVLVISMLLATAQHVGLFLATWCALFVAGCTGVVIAYSCRDVFYVGERFCLFAISFYGALNALVTLCIFTDFLSQNNATAAMEFFTFRGPLIMAGLVTVLMMVYRTHVIIWFSAYFSLGSIFYLNYFLIVMAAEPSVPT